MKRTSFFVTVLSALLPLVTKAAGTGIGGQIDLQTTNVRRPEDLLVIVNNLVDWMFTVLLILAVVFVIVAAFKYLFSHGNSEKMTEASKWLLGAAVAVAVALLAQAVIFIASYLVRQPIG